MRVLVWVIPRYMYVLADLNNQIRFTGFINTNFIQIGGMLTDVASHLDSCGGSCTRTLFSVYATCIVRPCEKRTSMNVFTYASNMYECLSVCASDGCSSACPPLTHVLGSSARKCKHIRTSSRCATDQRLCFS